MIKIAGTGYNFATGNLVQLLPGDVSSGEMDLDNNGFRFSFSDVRMYVNGELKRNRIVSDINIPQISGIKSTFTIVIPAGDTNAVLFEEGKRSPTLALGRLSSADSVLMQRVQCTFPKRPRILRTWGYGQVNCEIIYLFGTETPFLPP
jgi:hypothetical protein